MVRRAQELKLEEWKKVNDWEMIDKWMEVSWSKQKTGHI